MSSATGALEAIVQGETESVDAGAFTAQSFEQVMGLDHERLTFEHHGRPFRLTDVAGNVVKEILA